MYFIRTGKPGVLQSMGQQRVRHDWETELHWSYHLSICKDIYYKELAHFILGASRPKFYRGVHQAGNFGRNGCSRLEAEFLLENSVFALKAFNSGWGSIYIIKNNFLFLDCILYKVHVQNISPRTPRLLFD